MTEAREGGCKCGAVRYRMSGPPICVNACHCRDCQKLSGSAFALNAMIETDRLELVKGAPTTDGEGGVRCGHCETLLWAHHPMFGEGIAFLRAGTLDAGEAMAPDNHFFVRSKHPWVIVPDGVQAFETLPEDDASLFGPAQRARVAAAMRG